MGIGLKMFENLTCPMESEVQVAADEPSRHEDPDSQSAGTRVFRSVSCAPDRTDAVDGLPPIARELASDHSNGCGSSLGVTMREYRSPIPAGSTDRGPPRHDGRSSRAPSEAPFAALSYSSENMDVTSQRRDPNLMGLLLLRQITNADVNRQCTKAPPQTARGW